jgi:hypothetical protein
VTTDICLTSASDAVKTAVSSVLERGFEGLMAAAAAGESARELELAVLEVTNEVARSLLAATLARRNRQAMEADIARRGLLAHQVSVRLERAYWMSLMTSVGPVCVPMFSYRDHSRGVSVTRSPARDVFPLYLRCRSTEVCLEWETRLAGQHPFRKAEQMLSYFTHGAVDLEDTTIERHAIRIGHLISQEWLYRKRADMIEILKNDAAVDRKTGRPIIYVSCDAHALRRFVNESWTAQWKMMNGLRLWCQDRRTHRIIHLGGEFTCGDAHYLRERWSDLIQSGVVPADGEFGDGLVAQYVFVSDGMPWFEEHITPLLPDAVVILDAYHLMEHLAEFSKTSRGRHPEEVYREMLAVLFGSAAPKRPEPQYRRKGHTKRRRKPHLDRRPALLTRLPRTDTTKLIALVRASQSRTRDVDKLVQYVEANAHRMDYKSYRARGFQIGSGAMESIHRTGSQERTKRSGARWLPETLEAMFRLRMLEIVGRWNEWWSQPGFFATNAERFVDTAYRTRTGPVARKNPKAA